MRHRSAGLERLAVVVLALLGSACASYSGGNLEPGIATLSDVEATMGEPALRWKDDDGREQLAYPRGPQATQTFMVYVDAQGRLERIEGVLDTRHFARIEPGRTDQAAILRLLGPPQPQWTAYFERRDELVWEWRICDDWGMQAFLDVLFDGTTGIVRSSFQRRDYHVHPFTGRSFVPTCGH